MQMLWQDLRYGMRMLLKSPGFTAVAVIALALGIGANTAIFSVVNAVLLRPLPYQDSDRLIRVFESNPQRGWPEFSASAPNFKDWQQQQSVFEQLAAQELWTFNLTDHGEPERVSATKVTANLFPALGIMPVLGRNFLPEEEQVGRHRVVLLSHGLWQRRFGGDQALLGKTVQLNSESYTVIGIMPANFQLAGRRDVWVPLVLDPAKEPWRADRANRNISVIGKLKPGVSLAEAQAHMGTLARGIEQQYPTSNAGWGVRLVAFYEWLIPEQVRKASWVLLGAVGFVLLIACANVANLFLARATTRQREIAIRSALGASRKRIVRQLLTESCLLALLGGATGLLLAVWGVDLLVKYTPMNIPRLSEARIDRSVLLFTLAISLLTSILCGLMPALQAARVNLSEAFKEGSGSLTGVRHRARGSLVVAEIALALVLLAGAGLMVQSFVRLGRVTLGFNPENILKLQTALPGSQYRERSQQNAFYLQALERIRALPGVLGASANVMVPLAGGGNWALEVAIEDRPATGERLSADARAVMPHYFRTMGIPLLQGRDFTEQDGPGSTNIIISEAMARRFWPGENPLGKRFRPGTINSWMNIVGVVGDVRELSLEEDPRAAFYFSAAQLGFSALALVVRTAGNPESVTTAVRKEIAALDRGLPIYGVKTMSAILYDVLGQPRFQAALLSLFAVVASLLAAVGIYGVMSQAVTERTHEIGIRMALGARAGDVLNLVIGRGMKLALIGVATGLIAAFALTRLMRGLLFGVSPTDLITFAIIALLLTGIALLACYVPARRATKVDPMIALRSE